MKLVRKALADETRLQILGLLMAKEELCVSDIMGVLGITQSKTSRQMKFLPILLTLPSPPIEKKGAGH
jgi:DNA-binding transcriptional ArsR family regulator